MERNIFLFYEAIVACNFEQVLSLLKANVDVNAIYRGDERIVELSLNCGVNVETIGPHNCGLHAFPLSPLHLAVVCGNLKMVQLLLEHGALIDSEVDMKYRPIHYAAERGNADIIECLLSRGAEVDVTNSEGQTPLLLAAKYGKKEAVSSLLSGKADVNKKDCRLTSSLHQAVRYGYEGIAKLLIEHGAELNEKDGIGRSCLDLCAIKGNKTMLDLMFKAGAAYSCENGISELNPLHLAAECGTTNILEYLLEIGTPIDLKSANGYTPLHTAVRADSSKAMRFLIEKGASVNSKTIFEGFTALHLATISSCDVIEFLIQRGAKISEKDHTGSTTFDLIIERFSMGRHFWRLEANAKMIIKYDVLLTNKKRNEHVFKNISFRELFTNFWRNCETEVDEMKKSVIKNTTISVHAFLKAMFNETEFTAYLNNRSVIKGLKYVKDYLKKFPIYGNLIVMMEDRILTGTKKCHLLREANILLGKIVLNVPVEIKWRILSLLEIKDLNNFVLSFKNC